MLSSKKGQITIFIIIGILIVFAFALFFFIRGLEVEEKAVISRPVVERVPTELNPIVLYTEDCLATVAANGLVMLGQQGGYIYPDEHGDYSFTNPTDADGLVFSAGSNMKIPYWYYNRNPNRAELVKMASMRLALHRVNRGDMSIESQLDRYIEEELPVCLANYSVFKKQGYVIEEAGQLKAESIVIPNAVTVLVDYPLDVAVGASERRISQFFAAVDVDLNQIYEVANDMTNAEAEFSFLERSALNLIELFSDTSTEKLPPMTESTFDFVSTVFWVTPAVEQDIKAMLMSYIPILRFYGSRNYYSHKFDNAVVQQVYDDMVLDFGSETDLEVRFDYLDWWPIYLYINDDTGIIQPQSASVSFAGLRFGMQRFYNVYDISFPVLVTLTDANALDGRGYTFNFALEANIRNNQPADDNESLMPPIVLFEESMLCSPEQRTSANYTIGVKDNFNGSSLDKTGISYTVGEESCMIGVTDENGEFTGQFPAAYGGLITLAREDYLTKSVLFDARKADELAPGEDILEFEMDRIDTISVSVDKKKVWKYVNGIKIGSDFPFASPDLKTGWFFESAPHDLEPFEQVLVTLNRISDFDEEFTTAFSLFGDETAEIQLVPGTYEVNMQLFLNEFVKIPKRFQEECVKRDWTGKCTKEELIEIPEISFDVFPNGGLIFTNRTYWELTANNLYNSNTIVFYAVSPAISEIDENLRVMGDLTIMNEIEKYSKENKEDLEPVFS